jgi:hypothetical protein
VTLIWPPSAIPSLAASSGLTMIGGRGAKLEGTFSD